VRVGSESFYLRFLAGLERGRARSLDALEDLADGKKVRVGSDDPVGSQVALALRGRLVRLGGFERAANSTRVDLATLDRVLGVIVEQLTEAQQEAMAGASLGTDVPNEVRAGVIDGIREQLIALANTEQGGRYLFGGTETTTPPFAADGTYAGNAAEAQSPIDTREQVGGTLDGGRVFQGGGDVFTILEDLAQALRDNDTTAIGAFVPQFSAVLDHMAQVHADVGIRMQRIDETLLRHGDEAVQIVEQLGAIENVDLAEAVVQLQQADNSISALSAAAARVLGRSLFDYLG